MASTAPESEFILGAFVSFEKLMLPTTVGLDSYAIFSGFIDRAAGLEGEFSHGVNRSRWFGGGESLRGGRSPLGENLAGGKDVL